MFVDTTFFKVPIHWGLLFALWRNYCFKKINDEIFPNSPQGHLDDSFIFRILCGYVYVHTIFGIKWDNFSFWILKIQYWNIIEHLKCGQCNWGTDFKFYLILIKLKKPDTWFSCWKSFRYVWTNLDIWIYFLIVNFMKSKYKSTLREIKYKDFQWN